MSLLNKKLLSLLFGQHLINIGQLFILYGRVGRSPGLVAMGGDSRSEGRGFESRHCILDGHFFTYICCKNCNVCLKRPKINEKRPGLAHFLKEKTTFYFIIWSHCTHPHHQTFFLHELSSLGTERAAPVVHPPSTKVLRHSHG